MFAPVFAADWEVLIKVGTFVIVGLYYLITQLAKKAPVQPPPRRPQPIQEQPPQPANDPIQAEINEFLRQAQQRKDRRAELDQPMPSQPLAEPLRRPRPKRRTAGNTAKRESSRQPPPPPVIPVVVEVVETDRPRESLAEHLAHRTETSVFDQKTRPLSQMQQASDNEFQQHMQKVFDHQLGKLKPATMGMFEAAGAAAAASQASSVSTTSSQTSTAPMTIRKGASDIALFLAGKKNIRDAIILSEILTRPEDRW